MILNACNFSCKNLQKRPIFFFYKDQNFVLAYFPQDVWYDFYTGKTIPSSTRSGSQVVLEAPLDVINIHVRAGYILPLQDPELTTSHR